MSAAPLPGYRPSRHLAQPLSEEARLAIIEHNRNMRDQRAFAAANRERIDAEWDALPDVPLTIAQHIDHARMLRLAAAPVREGEA